MKSILGIAAVLASAAFGTAAAAPVASALAPILRPVAPVTSNVRSQPPGNLYGAFSWQRQSQQVQVCRVRPFFGSDVSKPLETIYFVPPGMRCAGYNSFYGFVILAP